MPITKSDIPDLLLPGLKADFAQAYRAEVETSVAERIALAEEEAAPGPVPIGG